MPRFPFGPGSPTTSPARPPALSDEVRARRRAIDALPAAEQPQALAELATMVEERGALPGVARAMRLKALELARAHLPADHALIADLEARAATSCRPSQRPAVTPTPEPITPAGWRERMGALARGKRRRR